MTEGTDKAAGSAPEILISAKGLVVGYQGVGLLPEVSLDIHRGQVWALVGRNGSGKTTLLRTLMGLLTPVSGDIHRDSALGIGYVAQRNDLDLSVPYRVRDLVAGGLDKGLSFLIPGFIYRRQGDRQSAITRALADCDLLGLENQPFAQLSEGQKQRVLMARAIVGGPSLLILDEPTSAMDIVSEQATFDLILNLQATRGLAVLLVTHQIGALSQLGSHGVFVDRDEGQALVGTLSDILNAPSFRRRYGLEAPHGG